jgi:hypothetical protein
MTLLADEHIAYDHVVGNAPRQEASMSKGQHQKVGNVHLKNISDSPRTTEVEGELLYDVDVTGDGHTHHVQIRCDYKRRIAHGIATFGEAIIHKPSAAVQKRIGTVLLGDVLTFVTNQLKAGQAIETIEVAEHEAQ